MIKKRIKKKKKKKKRRTGGRPVCVPRRIAGAEPLELSRNAATDTEDEATSAENTAAGPGTAREGDGSPGVRAGRDPRAHGQKQGRGSRGSDRRQRRWKQFRGRSFSHCQLWILPFLSPVMSSLLREEMQRVLFRPAKQRLVEFIEIEEPPQGRHFLCVSVAKNKLVQLSIVQCQVSQTPLKSGSNRSHTQRSSIQECYRRTEIWSLQDLTLVDGRDPDVDDPCFLLHFDKVRTVTAISCSAKYSIVRALVALSDQHCQRSLNLQNFDWAYIKPTSFYSNRGDCVVLSQICFYAFNLVCLSMCPVPLDG